MWESETLTANERCVAYVYGRYAGRSDISWCLWDELRKRTGIKSRDAIHRAVKGLIKAGWLILTEAAKQHYSARYRLTIPSQGSGKRTSETTAQAPSSPANGRLEGAATGPVVRETDIPVVRQTKPVVRLPDPSTQTQNSDLQPGGTLPPDPLRPEHPSGTRNDQAERLTAVPHLNSTKQVTHQTRTRKNAVAQRQIPIMFAIDGGLSPEPIPTDPNQLDLIPEPTPPDNAQRQADWDRLQNQLTRINTHTTKEPA